MAQFIGKWKGDGSSYTNYDAFAKASEFPAEMIEQFRNAVNEYEFKRDGDTWTCVNTSTAAPSKTYQFKSGEENNSTDPWGNNVKFKVTFVSDTKMIEEERAELNGWKPITVVREITGNKMLETTSLEDGTSMTSEMTRQA